MWLVGAFFVFQTTRVLRLCREMMRSAGLRHKNEGFVEVVFVGNECQARRAVEGTRAMLCGRSGGKVVGQVVSTGPPRDDV